MTATSRTATPIKIFGTDPALPASGLGPRLGRDSSHGGLSHGLPLSGEESNRKSSAAERGWVWTHDAIVTAELTLSHLKLRTVTIRICLARRRPPSGPSWLQPRSGPSRFQAQKLIDAFLAAAKAKGIAPQPLRATLYSGQSVKTDKVGWYLRKNQSVAVGDDGSYYVLIVPGGFRERLSGVKLQPSPPPLVVGKGGKDGETGDLAEFLQLRLEPGWAAS